MISLGVTIWDHQTFSYGPSCNRFSFDRTSWRIPVCGTCLAQSPERTNAFMERSCWNGRLTAWTFHPRTRTCWRRVETAAGLSQKSGGVVPSPWPHPCKSLQERHLLRRWSWRRRFAALAMFSGLGRAGQGALSSSTKTSQRNLKKSLIRAVIKLVTS